MRKLQDLLALLFILILINLTTNNNAFSYDIIQPETLHNGNYKINFIIQNKGDYIIHSYNPKDNSYRYSYRVISSDETTALLRAGSYWSDLLNASDTQPDSNIYVNVSTIDLNGLNAQGASYEVCNSNRCEPLIAIKKSTLGNQTIANIRFMDKKYANYNTDFPMLQNFPYHGAIEIGNNVYNDDSFSYYLNRIQNIMPSNFETIMIHELAHVFGFSAKFQDIPEDSSEKKTEPNYF
jgi:hypothetical protein